MRYAEIRDGVVNFIGESDTLPPGCVDISDVENVDVRWTWDGTEFASPESSVDVTSPPALWKTSIYRAAGPCVIRGFEVPVPSSFAVSFAGGLLWDGDAAVEISRRGLLLNQDGTHEIFVDESRAIRARRSGRLPARSDHVLFDVLVDAAVDPVKPVRIIDRRTLLDTGARRPARMLDRLQACRLTSGPYASGFRTSPRGDLRWATVNAALYPWVEDLGAQVRQHLDLQLSLFGATGQTDWTALHGTAWGGQTLWPYDVTSTDDFASVFTLRRASHSAVVTSFLRLATRVATTSAAGLTWWNANYAAIWAVVQANLLAPLVPLPDAGAAEGQFIAPFQDLAVGSEIATEDMVRAWRTLRDALSLMTSNGGTQATDATSAAGLRNDLAKGLRNAWRTDANSAGDSGWVSPSFRNGWRANNHRQWSDLRPYLLSALYGATYGTAVTELGRQARGFDIVFALAPRWWNSNNVSSWDGEAAAALAAAGIGDLAEETLSFALATGAPMTKASSAGWVRYLQRLMQGDTL